MKAEFSDELTGRMLLAVSEAVANAVEHGNCNSAGRSVTLEWTGDANGGWLSVEDEGVGLTIDRLKNAALPKDPLQTGGRGLFIIKELTDDLALKADGRRLKLWFAPRPVEKA